MKPSYSPQNSRSGHTKQAASAPAQLRCMSRLTQKKFASLCGLNFETYCDIERKMNAELRGKSWVSRYHAEQIALVAGVDVDALMRNELVCLDGKTPYAEEHWGEYQDKLRQAHSRISGRVFERIQEKVVHACAMADHIPGPGPLLWYVALAIELDHFYKVRKSLLIIDGSEDPTLISMMLQITQDEVARASIERMVESDHMRRPARFD